MIDLHIHTNLSDGTDSVEKLIDKLQSSNIKTFSITDHDNIEADKIIKKQYLKLLNEKNIKYISGVEFSTDYKGQSMHILAYNYSSSDEVVSEIVDYIHSLRLQRFSRRIDDIKTDFNITFSDEELEWMFSRNNPGKPHIATILVNNGYAESITEAISKYMPKRLNEYKVSAIDVIKKLSSHGVLVGIAHPLGGEGEDRISVETFEKNVESLVEHGISFLECYYSLYDEHEREIIKMVADKYGLLLSGGSDYHGKNKDIKLGELGVDYDNINSSDLTIITNFS